MKTIFCPTDFSKNSINAITYACELGDRFSSHVILFHSYESPAVVTEVGFTVIDNAERIIKEGAIKKLNALRQKFSKKYPRITITTQIVSGAGYDKAVTSADTANAELIVMGTTGHSRLERLLMGSTTSRVIRDAGCPVLCIPKESTFKGIRKIVFATDLQEDNIASAVAIAPFAMQLEAEIVFVFVDDKHLMHSEEDIRKMTKKIRSRVKYPKISGYISKNASISKGLDFFIKKFPADLLVMFTHHKNFTEGLFHQSITKIMSHQTRIPLLALKVTDRPIA